MTSTTPRKATLREWIGLLILMLPTILISMDTTVLHLAVPALTADLQPTGSQLLWITDIYGFIIAGALITMGTLGDRIGRRRLLMIGGVSFGLASAVAAFATTPGMLIAARALLGLTGATLMPSTMSLIRNMFPVPRERAVAIGFWVSGFSLGGSIGPLVGGLLLEYFWWGSVFLLAVPPMLILLIGGMLVLPEYRDPNPGRFDLLSAGLSLGAVLSMIYGLKQMAENGISIIAILTTVIGLVLGVVFIRRQQHLADPLIDLRLFKVREFSASLGIYTFGIFFNFGMFLFIAQYMQLVVGLTPLEAGIWSIPGAFASVIGSNIAPRLARHIRPAYIVSGGLLLAAVSMFLLLTIARDSLMTVVVANTLMSMGFGFAFSLTVDLVVSAAPPERAGAASAIAETGAELGGAMGLALLGSLGMAIYRSLLLPGLPAEMPAETAHAAMETLGAALVTAESLPVAQATTLITTAQDAFVQAIHINAVLGALGFGLLALIMATLLRHVRIHIEADAA